MSMAGNGDSSRRFLPPRVLPARSPPQLALGFDQTVAGADWPEMDQTAGTDDGWQ
jgi:hypothetical protein